MKAGDEFVTKLFLCEYLFRLPKHFLCSLLPTSHKSYDGSQYFFPFRF